MKNIFNYLSILILILLQNNCYSQNQDKVIYNEDFKWTISIPDNFEQVSTEYWEQQQNIGLNAIENTVGEEVINQAKTIFVYKSGEFNILESNYQPFDEAIDGDYIESFDGVDEILYQTFITQMPGVKVDRQRGTQLIDNLLFQTSIMKITYPNNMILYAEMYSRLFGKREFTVSIMYVDQEKGEQMKHSFLNSKFKK